MNPTAQDDAPRTSTGRIDGRSARKVETRRRIMAAASELFAEQGFAGTSMDEIAEAAGVSKGTIFYNYKNKVDLFEKLVESSAAAIRADLDAAREGQQGWVALTDAMWRILCTADEQPAPAQIVMTELFRTNRPWASSLPRTREQIVQPLVEIISELAEDRRSRGLTPAILPEHLPNVAMSVIGALVVATLDRRAFMPERPLEEVHRGLMLAISGLQ